MRLKHLILFYMAGMALAHSAESLAQGAGGSPPVMKPLPTVTIGDLEGGGENNYFTFPNAFRFDSYVYDQDTSVSQLIWTFDEGDDPGSDGTGTQWFTVNGIPPVHVGTGEQASDFSGSSHHLTGSGGNLRSVGEFASIRDIVLSPDTDPLVFSFPSPTTETLALHGAGKVLTFYVSDGVSVASSSMVVKVADNTSDTVYIGINPPPIVFNEFVGTEGWMPTAGNTTSAFTSYNSADTSLRAGVQAVAANRIIGWMEGSGNGLSYGQIGSGKYVRAKFNLYAGGQQGTRFNEIPNLRLRVSSIWAATSILDVYHHSSWDPELNAMAREFRPSQDPLRPSVYRVDFDPPEVPYVQQNSTATVMRMFETYSTAFEPQENGYLALTESSIAAYPALPDSNSTAVLVKTYSTESDFTSSLHTSAMQMQRGSLLPVKANVNGTTFTYEGQTFPLLTSDEVQVTAGAGGVTLDTTGTTDTLIAIATADFLQGNAEDSDYTKRVRVEEDKVYKVRFHATSTVPASRNAMIRFRARTCKFNWVQRLEVGGAWALNNGGPSDLIAQQFLPGVGSRNADRRPGDTNGGFYNLLMVSPLSADIRAETTGTLAARMPRLTAQPGPGENAPSRRDLAVGVDIIDSLSGAFYQFGSSDQESGNVTVDRIEIRKYDLVPD